MLGRQASRIAVVVAICSGCGGANPATAPAAPSPTPTSTQTILATRAIPPNNLVAPIDPTAISLEGAPMNPFGVVRSALDQGPVGHPGIDLPSAAGTPVLAVAAGRIVTVGQAEPYHLAGQEVRLLIGEGPEAGTGWVFSLHACHARCRDPHRNGSRSRSAICQQPAEPVRWQSFRAGLGIQRLPVPSRSDLLGAPT